MRPRVGPAEDFRSAERGPDSQGASMRPRVGPAEDDDLMVANVARVRLQ